MDENLLGRNKERGEKWNDYRIGEGDGEKSGGTWQRMQGSGRGERGGGYDKEDGRITKNWHRTDNTGR